MSELLTTKEILAALENIIKKADKYICIFTFNIKIDQNYLSRLRNASKRGVKITIVFGVDNGEPEVIQSILAIENCTVYFKEYLHAKFFYNEKELLVGSMNLSEASAKNNFELGVLFTGDEYLSVIKKVKEEAREIIEDATEWQKLIPTNDRRSAKPSYQKFEAACIRCHKSILYNPERPLCSWCYQEWAEWENEYYLENYCHNCGNEHEGISYAKPQCYSCYKISAAVF